ncbi:glycosyltransferase family 2 protein [Marinomonas arctica]|uniref:Glycosyltransferase family 2 protein n=1 Tax=Marinomonas arctica TaxID=383750 RepID=A0A7H1J436_9GAMM|nr:glycosyltransferase family 2 protein [Marinomonas arctica]MCS7487763.1 hypothetical protein [Marinomonas sp. BSi20414]QNT05252.1 glycosyltransferase family 2 protein [Marinomonas arctica]GGN37369.1 glycosyl transferase [Marinomonas arctica]
MFKLHGVVVLYQPDDSVWRNIQSYLAQVDILFVVDNSEVKNTHLISQVTSCDHIVYIDNGGNKGIATALNIAAQRAISAGASWLLTMDQDSVFLDQSLSALLAEAKSLPSEHNVGVLSPVHATANVRVAFGKEGSSAVHAANKIFVDVVMASGNIINLAAYQRVGGFLDKYFIDSVDHEYCLALKRKGYQIIVLTSSVLEHNLGDMACVQWFGRKIFYTNHSAIRRYYITRNRLDLVCRHGLHFPFFASKELYHWLGEWVKILLFEQQKWKKSVFIVKGIFDFIRRRFGKLS